MKLTVIIFVVGIAVVSAVSYNRMAIEIDYDSSSDLESDEDNELIDGASDEFFLDEVEGEHLSNLKEDQISDIEAILCRGGCKPKPKCDDHECSKKCCRMHKKGRCQHGRCKCCGHCGQ